MEPCRTSEYYDPNQDMWSTGPPLPDSVSFAAYSVLQVSTFQEDDFITMETNREGSALKEKLCMCVLLI
jgi:hypothetical protein